MTRSVLASVAFALVLTFGAAVVPPAARPAVPLLAAFDAPAALAADDIAISTAARYTVVPDKAVVRVTVDIKAVNAKPNNVSGGVVTRYYYDALNLGVQPEGTRFRATEGDAPLRVTTDRRPGYRLVTITLRSSLFFQESTRVRLTYDLPSGPPRSSSDVRVGAAFASFVAWAFGDGGTVRVDVPKAFDVTISGASMERSTTEAGVQVYRASTSTPTEWYAWVTASNRDGLTRLRMELPGGEVIVVRAWPEDSRWRSRVSSILKRGVPALAERIGLPWPVDGALNVVEVHTPLLEGYAGFYDRARDEITISEDLDDLTVVHEASHAWLNGTLFSERWITEGLAEAYASQVVDELGGTAPGPAKVSRTAKAAFPLNDWPPPAPIRTDKADARERYGYDAAYSVISRIVASAGADGMRKVFAAASAGTTAYPGERAPEPTVLPGDWRRFLDLTEELGGAQGVAALLATWALPEGEAAGLEDRARARAAYRELVAAGGDWAPPVTVRRAMDGWQFGDAGTAIGTASGILGQRDSIEATAAADGLDAPGDLEAAYEGASSASELDAAARLAADTGASLAQVALAADAVAAPRDWLTELGLAGKDPDRGLATARAAWEAGDMATAKDAAMLVSGTLAVAADAGRGRILVTGGTLGLVLLLIVAVVLLLRRRSRRRAAARTIAGGGIDGEPGVGDDARDDRPG